MSNRWIPILLIGQIATLALLAGLLLRESIGPKDLQALTDLRNQMSGALNRQHEIALFLDDLRVELRKLLESRREAGTPTPGPGEGEGPSEPTANLGGLPSGDGAAAPVLPDVPFPEAFVALEELHKVIRQRQDSVDQDETFLASFDRRIEELESELLRRGTDSLHWLNWQIALQPFDEDHDPAFSAFLLEDVLPELSGADPDAAFQIARSALVRETNGNRVRDLAAHALRLIDDEKWAPEVLAVIARAGESERAVSLRVGLMDMFIEDPRPEIVPYCKEYLEEPRHPMPLRSKAIWVLAAQDSGAVDTTLRRVVFEEAAPNLRMHSLDALYHRLAGSSERDGFRRLLEEVIDADAATMQASVREKAQHLLESLNAPGP
jgi:hypothetical protein